MDQREPPRNPNAEGRLRDPDGPEDPPPGLRRTFPRLVRVESVRRVAPQRLAALVVALSLAAAGVVLSAQFIIRYEHAQPSHQVSYLDIRLDPPPPAWYRGGAPAFLEHVWASSVEPKTFSALDVDLDELTVRFRRYPWVKKVDRVGIVGYPNGVVARIDYREPVAVSGAVGPSEFFVDAEGVVLPADDVDRKALGPVVTLHGLTPPLDPKAGEVWSRWDERTRAARPDAVAIAAAGLAGFLKPRLPALASALPGWRYAHVMPALGDSANVREFYLQITCGETWMLAWDKSSDPEAASLTFEDRWAMLLDWARRTTPGRAETVVYLVFTRQGVAPDPDHPNVPAATFRTGRRGGRPEFR